jgi:D-alanine-D-alanine ligase
MKKIRVAIIAGGRSSEHPISCISASGVLAAIDRSKFEPILFGITQSGTWIDMRQSDFERGSDGLSYVPEGGEQLIVDIHGIKDSKGSDLGIDIAFPLLHGAYGEDGTIQGLFEMAGIAYVGSGVLASAVAMDKSFAKPIYADFGLKVAD